MQDLFLRSLLFRTTLHNMGAFAIVAIRGTLSMGVFQKETLNVVQMWQALSK